MVVGREKCIFLFELIDLTEVSRVEPDIGRGHI